MNYDEIAKAAEELSYRDKFRLAQLLIQRGRKEEEEEYPESRTESTTPFVATSPETIAYVSTRLARLRPSKKASLLNAIAAMYQFQGAISDIDKEAIVTELSKSKFLSIDSNNRVSYNTSICEA